MYLLDSSICIDLMRGAAPLAYQLMRESDPAMFKVPVVAAAELYFGAEHSSNPQKNRLITARFLQPYEILPFDDAAAHAYAGIRHKLKVLGKPIGPNGMLIAATALSRQLVLVTGNDREFFRVEGLQVESWHEIDLSR